MRFVESRGKVIMDLKFLYEEDFLIIKLSGAADVNERLWVKEYLAPHLGQPWRKVIIDLEGLDEIEGVYALGVLNSIKKEFQLLGAEVKLCSLNPKLHDYFHENRLDQIFDIGQSVESVKQSFKERNNGRESRRD